MKFSYDFGAQTPATQHHPGNEWTVRPSSPTSLVLSGICEVQFVYGFHGSVCLFNIVDASHQFFRYCYFNREIEKALLKLHRREEEYEYALTQYKLSKEYLDAQTRLQEVQNHLKNLEDQFRVDFDRSTPL